MPEIEIYMLGKFMILVDGHDIIEKLGNSKKPLEGIAQRPKSIAARNIGFCAALSLLALIISFLPSKPGYPQVRNFALICLSCANKTGA